MVIWYVHGFLGPRELGLKQCMAYTQTFETPLILKHNFSFDVNGRLGTT